MPEFRSALAKDIPYINEIDHVVLLEEDREKFIETAVAENRAYVLLLEGVIIGYGILHHHFFGRTFLDMVYVAENRRNKGYGAKIIKEMEHFSITDRVFTSTNQSNTTMRHVLGREGWKESGHIENLDEDDPEIIYFKILSGE